MNYAANPVKPDTLDVYATAIHLAAIELAEVYPHSDPSISVATWKSYLLQQALKKQDQMTEEERFVFRQEHLT